MPEVADVPVTGPEIGIAVRALNAIGKKLGRPERVAILSARQSRRSELREKLEWPKSGGVPEAIVVRLSKMDKYPDTESVWFGLFPNSPWNKFEVKAAGDRDLEVFIKIDSVYFTGRRKRKARRAPFNGPPPGGAPVRKVWVVGRIPYEKIAYFDWSGDPTYSLPRIYVKYGLRGPFREIALYEEFGAGRRDSSGPDLFEIHNVKYQDEGGNPWRWTRFTASRLRFSLEQRRDQKRFEREVGP